MVDSTRLNKFILKFLSTENIVELVVEYPLLLDVYAFNTDEASLENLSSISYAYNELLTRKDALVFIEKHLGNFTNLLIVKSLNIMKTDIRLIKK